MSDPHGRRVLGGILGFTLISRAIGVLREAIIAAGFGFSRATDGFYQLAATPTYLVTFLGGPFSTAYIAWSNRDDAPEESLRLALVLRWLLFAAVLLSAAFLAVALRLEFAAERQPQWLPPLLMALACTATAVIGLAAAVANARSRFVAAQAVLFVNNAAFVLLLGLSALLLRSRIELALTSAFAGAALIAALFGWRVMRSAQPLPAPTAAQRRQAGLSLRRVFLPMLGMAGVETLGFLASQALVLWLAAHSGTGITSAGSLAQRIALTANGLVVGPLANVAMVRLMRLEREEARRYLLRIATLTLAGLALAAAAISAGAVLVGAHSHSLTLSLLTRLLPAYSLWLVAQGANIMLNRLSFARGAARRYTAITLAGYALANIARLGAWRTAGFATAIAAGATVEIIAALVILAGIARRPALKSVAFVPEPSP